MRFQVLGPLRLASGDRWSVIHAGQQRSVLAVLLAEAGRTVSAHRLVQEIWGDHPPRGALGTLQGYVFRLRRLIDGGRDTLLTCQGGYELVVAEGDLDAHEFQSLTAQARRHAREGSRSVALDRFREALDLWRGPALADVRPTPTVLLEATRLEQARLQAHEERLDLLLDHGMHVQAVAEAQQLIASYPLRERLWEQFIVALARAGRRSEALGAYQSARRTLVAELGVEPSASLQSIHQEILDGRITSTPAVAARTFPAELPSDVTTFVGRAAELRRLDAIIAAKGIATIVGPPGVGKTALAVRWGHRNRDIFPHGQLFIDLRGYAQGPPLTAAGALARLLRTLGSAPESIPGDVDEAAAHYRTLLADKQLLLILDNARDAAQVRPLLPGGGCRAVVTSRDRMIGLIAHDDAAPLYLDTLAPAESLELLDRMLGAERVVSVARDAVELSQLCGHLPLALRIAAAHLAARGAMSIEDYTTRMRESCLDQLDVPGDPTTGVRAAFDQSYAALSAPAGQLFRRLGMFPGGEFHRDAVAALADTGAWRAGVWLDELHRAHLIEETSSGRYVVHDLLRQYAMEKTLAVDSDQDRRTAQLRLLHFYQSCSDAAASILYPHLVRLPQATMDEAEPFKFAGKDEATRWLDTERSNLVAVVCAAANWQHHEAAWRIADNLRGYLYLQMHLTEWAIVAGAAKQAADTAGNPAAQASALISLAAMHWAQGHSQPAIDCLLPALPLVRQAGWAYGEAAVLGNLGAAYGNMGNLAKDIEYAHQALAIDRRIGSTAGQATRLTNIALTCLAAGRPKEAIELFQQSLELHRELQPHPGQARAMANLGEAYLETGQPEAAIAILTEALQRQREWHDRHTEADTLRVLAAAHLETGDTTTAASLARRSEQIAQDIGENRVLAYALLVQSRLNQSIDHSQQAVAIAQSINDRLITAEANVALALAHLHAGQLPDATTAAFDALNTATSYGYRTVQADAHTALGRINLIRGIRTKALRHFTLAAEINDKAGREHRAAEARTLAAQAQPPPDT